MAQLAVGGPTLGPPPPKRYKIGELAAYTGLTRQTLHNYTRWGLIREVGWTDGGHRLYDESVFSTLARIMALRGEHTIEQIRAVLDRDNRSAGDAMSSSPPDANVDEPIGDSLFDHAQQAAPAAPN